MKIRTRFAPSPTGYLHIGGARTALFCWLYTRRLGGTFVLRIEDTDLERSTEASVQVILDAMEWLGLDYDEGPYYQTERFDRYREVIEQLLAEDKAYHCYCTREELDEIRTRQREAGGHARYDGRCRQRTESRAGVDPVVRFKNPVDGQVVVDDLVRGQVAFANKQLDDLIIARSDGSPTYNFTVVVDDMDMGMTHVIRGDDHLNNTPRQINIYRALGAQVPEFAHLPMILGADGSRLSKRHGSVSVLEYRDKGYLPEALLNYLVRLGWSHGDQEIFTIEQMTELFDIADVNKAASTFNPEKLVWINQQYLREAPPERLAPLLARHLARLDVNTTGGPSLEAVAAVQRERCSTLEEMAEVSEFFFRDIEAYHEKAAKKHLKLAAREPLARTREKLGELEDWSRGPIHEVVAAVAAELELGMGKVAQPIRVAVSGGPVSPSIDLTLELLGKDKTLQRLDKAIEFVMAKLPM